MKASEMRCPPYLVKGDLVALTAPARKITEAEMQPAAGVGGINLYSRDRSGIVRRIPMLFSDGERIYPGLAGEALRVVQGQKGIVVRGTGASVPLCYPVPSSPSRGPRRWTASVSPVIRSNNSRPNQIVARHSTALFSSQVRLGAEPA